MSTRFFTQMTYVVWLAYGAVVMLTAAGFGERRLRRRLHWCERLSFNGNAYWDHVEADMFLLSYTITRRLIASAWYKKHPRVGKVIALVEDLVMRIIDLTLWPIGVLRITQFKDAIDAKITQMVCKYE